MAALVEHLGGPAVVVGHSFTPDSALYAATAVPDSVRAVVLIAPWAQDVALSPLMRLGLRLVVRFPFAWGMFYKSLYPGSKPADFAAHLTRLKSSLGGRDGMAGLAAMADPTSKDAVGYRARSTRPALIVMGSADPDFDDPAAEAQLMADQMKAETQIVMIPDAGHYPQAQAPVETTATIVSFLDGIGFGPHA